MRLVGYSLFHSLFTITVLALNLLADAGLQGPIGWTLDLRSVRRQSGHFEQELGRM